MAIVFVDHFVFRGAKLPSRSPLTPPNEERDDIAGVDQIYLSAAGTGRSGADVSKLELVPMPLDEANAFVKQVHRHHGPVVGHKFSLGAVKDGEVVGVAIVGRPVSRIRDNGLTLEVARLATDGTRNACSFLYGACARATFALGYKSIGTYILASESGASLKASGWRCLGERGGGSWSVPSRPRVDKHPTQMKILFELSADTP